MGSFSEKFSSCVFSSGKLILMFVRFVVLIILGRLFLVRV